MSGSKQRKNSSSANGSNAQIIGAEFDKIYSVPYITPRPRPLALHGHGFAGRLTCRGGYMSQKITVCLSEKSIADIAEVAAINGIGFDEALEGIINSNTVSSAPTDGLGGAS